MQEGSVTAAGQTYQLKSPFFVLANQDPIEQEGTYPLPEAQLDRFMFKVRVPFLNRAELNEVVRRSILSDSPQVSTVIRAEQILQLRKVLQRVMVTDPMRDYAVRLVLATHPESEQATDQVKRFVRWGASPRAAQALIRAARVRALASGREHVAFEDIQHFATEVLGHRVLLNYDGQAENLALSALIDGVVGALPETVA